MRNKRYMPSIGLAFSEALDMKKLSEKAAKGWHLKRFRLAGYGLEKGEPEEVIFSIDYRKLRKDDEEEYFELFAYGGWTHVCSSAHMHIFKAAPKTTPIYSDAESSIDKLARLAKPINLAASIALAITMVLWVFMTFASGTIQHIAEQGFTYSFIFTVPAMMTFGGVYYHMCKNLRLKSKHI
ncbi:DUF2812 domain-containing protein [Lysinibacillus xylanilyticus]|uniref:DUF2812 domain-containing protein n=1 Tax=Lysinibacillus xylanilyticus TaxID=582475 RepID=UPI002B23FF18|nr:DUF2812 domain-containing protein [Lysinibacillus xylanilyticus]MEB2302697.1 DUF2812 domain-containing protein [Lysinibacillus xylanilyticus]